MRCLQAMLAIPLLLSATFARAQQFDQAPIETDRDSFTPATETVEMGRLVLESGYSFIDNRDAAETHSLPELIARYGVTDWLEFRLGSNYEVGGEANAISGNGGGGDFDGAEIESEAKVRTA
jgi:hypothetical protein